MADQRTLTANGASIPKLGFGTWKLKGDEGAEAVKIALETGYRHIDTAQVYENEGAVGAGLQASGVAREDVFVTTKVWMDRYRAGDLATRVRESVERLKSDYVDLLLLHWPNEEVALKETIQALNAAKTAGLTRHIGVSNFTTKWLGEAVTLSEAPLVTNQVEYHPFLDQTPVLDAARGYAMSLTAYSPIAQGKVFEDETLGEIAARHAKTPSQIALKWLIDQPGVVAIPRSSKPKNIAANFDVFDIELSADDTARIDALRRPDGRLIDPSWAPAWDVAA